jgi:hypothetical protein
MHERPLRTQVAAGGGEVAGEVTFVTEDATIAAWLVWKFGTDVAT